MDSEKYMEKTEQKTANYTCNDYRAEMVLLGLQRQLARPDLTPEEKAELKSRIAEAEKQMGLD
ncbi:MAG TPA: hypothetical protein DHV36_22485 [Desulfobacteraceae bacterium]|nr:hypothetical protein [Desulfobacteraceae bacterium]|tara:strand:+ start:128 stop:316 length:189 start_codon:yes stop_codon:yes gene_type:complete